MHMTLHLHWFTYDHIQTSLSLKTHLHPHALPAPQITLGDRSTGSRLKPGLQLRATVCTHQHSNSTPQANLRCPLLDVHLPLHGDWLTPFPALPLLLHTVLVRIHSPAVLCSVYCPSYLCIACVVEERHVTDKCTWLGWYFAEDGHEKFIHHRNHPHPPSTFSIWHPLKSLWRHMRRFIQWVMSSTKQS